MPPPPGFQSLFLFYREWQDTALPHALSWPQLVQLMTDHQQGKLSYIILEMAMCSTDLIPAVSVLFCLFVLKRSKTNKQTKTRQTDKGLELRPVQHMVHRLHKAQDSHGVI